MPSSHAIKLSLYRILYVFFYFVRYRRYFGVVLPHKKAATYTARRSELIDLMDQTLFFLNRTAMVRVYSPYSDLPRYVSYIDLILVLPVVFKGFITYFSCQH